MPRASGDEMRRIVLAVVCVAGLACGGGPYLGAAVGGFVLGIAADPPGTIEVSGPTVVGFFPPVSQAELEAEPAISEALAHLRFALDDVSDCLASIQPQVHLQLTAELVLSIEGSTRRIPLPVEPERSFGAFLIRPRAEPRSVYSSGGASSLVRLVPAAAAEYFDVPGCRSDLDPPAA